MLKQRLLTVAIVLPLFVAALFLLPNAWWSAVMVALILVAAHEWARLGGFDPATEAVFIAMLLACCAGLWFDASVMHDAGAPTLTPTEQGVLAISLAFWCVIAPCLLWLKPARPGRALLMLAGLLLCVPTWLAAARLQRDPWLLLLLLAVIWIADSAAYFSGRTWGRHKLAPTISPGKTWEGVAGALVAVTVYAFLVHKLAWPNQPLVMLVAAFLGMTVLSIIGDLFESWSKRRAGVKDSGGIFPGHGGMLDRIDALTAALPLAALLFA